MFDKDHDKKDDVLGDLIRKATTATDDLLPQPGDLVCGCGRYYSQNSRETGLNNNVLVIGGPGTGKTRSIVEPYLLNADGESLVVCDPKGILYGRYREYLEWKGYDVRIIDFCDMANADSCSYNPLLHVDSIQDIQRLAHIMAWIAEDKDARHSDIFWQQSAELFLTALIAYMREREEQIEKEDKEKHVLCVLGVRLTDELVEPYETEEADDDCQTLHALVQLIGLARTSSWKDDALFLDPFFDHLRDDNPDSYACRMYALFRAAADKTMQSIVITAAAAVGRIATPENKDFLATDTTEMELLGHKKMSLFVKISDSDRSSDAIISIFFSQLFQTLVREGDASPGGRLPVPVRVIMDDFATNFFIADFPQLISSMRSRDISCMVILQAESQLEEMYGKDSRTVVAGCDTYIYLGGGDLETCRHVAEKSQAPLASVLALPVSTGILFRRGDPPSVLHLIDPDKMAPDIAVRYAKPIDIIWDSEDPAA